MAGVSGINDVVLARNGVAGDDGGRHAGTHRRRAAHLARRPAIARQPGLHPARRAGAGCPFADRSFDLTWEWAGLWYIADPAGLLRELARTSRNLVFVAMPNNIQVGYWMRKLVIDREFFATHDESWTDIGRIRRTLEAEGVEIIEEGVLDTPPWPDTVMPANEVLKRLGIRSQQLEAQFTGEGWHLEHDGLLPGRGTRPVRPGDEVRLARPRAAALAGQVDLGAPPLSGGARGGVMLRTAW
jgi:SAM-dependent methyltransferase